MRRCALLFSCLALVACTHHHHADEGLIEARGFVVTDENGRPRGLWSYRPSRKTVGFSLLDEAERLRANLLVIDDQPTFTLLDRRGTIRANLSLHDSDTPSLVLLDAEGRQRVQLMLDHEDGAPVLVLLGAGGDPLVVTRDEAGEALEVVAGDPQAPSGAGEGD